jgi:UDP-N-acetylglucosamine 1-carboxyvinyltransferase
MGCSIECDDTFVNIDASLLSGGNVYFDVVSVGATINAILASVLAPGKTVLENCAKEPHVVDLANFLNSAGARIVGAGTDVIKIHGVESLKSVTYSIIPDQIEAGTYMAAAVATRGDILVKNIIPKHLDCITSKFIEMGVEIEEYDEEIRVKADKPLKSIRVKTLPYPGFPTDLQPQMVVLLATVGGKSVVTEGVWESRFQYIEELEKMGIRVSVDGTVATIDGGVPLKAAKLRATDLRAGASMIIAALAGEGTSEIYELRHIDRGYEHIVEKLRGMGADIERVDD